MDRVLSFKDTPLFRAVSRLGVALHHIHLFHQDPCGLRDHLDDLAPFSLSFPRDYGNQIILLDRQTLSYRHHALTDPAFATSDYLWRQGNNLHKPRLAQLSGHRTKNSRPNRVILLIQEHRGVPIEFNV